MKSLQICTYCEIKGTQNKIIGIAWLVGLKHMITGIQNRSSVLEFQHRKKAPIVQPNKYSKLTGFLSLFLGSVGAIS